MSAYHVIPLQTSSGRFSISDDSLLAIWRQIVAEEKVESLFYGGGIDTPQHFLNFIKSPQLIASIVMDVRENAPCAIGWLTNAAGGSAFVHYCVLGRPSRAAGRALLDHWCSFRGPDGKRLFHVLLGITPETHEAALRVLRIMGFTSIGTIPHYCQCAYEGGWRGGVISYFECAAP